MYKTYCENAKVAFPFSQRIFKEELKNYFRDYKERLNLDDGTRVRSYYEGFRAEKFEDQPTDTKEGENIQLELDCMKSLFDSTCAGCPAQYATLKETPFEKWGKVTSKLSDLDTSKIHYVKVPENHIVIDFDIPDDKGDKSLARNLEEAAKWPPTYAEISKGGAGVHLHYIYNGDTSKLRNVYDDYIEIKIPIGSSSLRRKLTKCNNLPIATISSGLPLKGETKIINLEGVKSEKGLREMIKRNLNKEFHPGTKPSIDFIHKILDDAYASGLNYDVTNMRNAVLAFGASSTNQADYCIKLVNKMQFKSAEQSSGASNDDAKLVFYDVEVFPNLFLVNWKIEGEGKQVVHMINPSPAEIEELMRFRLVGFNCRRYDNHILYGRLMGYTNEQLYNLSQKIISGSRNCFFGEAYNVSYTDVYDFSSKKQSLKKFEIELGLHHQELGLQWDDSVPEEIWIKVAEYCDNDVIATEATFNARKSDFLARRILADVAGMYGDIALLDIASMHPSSIVAEKLFGEEYTQRFDDILQARIAIKHKDFDRAKKMLGGALAKYLTDESAASDLASALKIAINSVYGLTSASFENPFHDPRNKDNIVAKRGALFMINLKHEVQKRGFVVAHVKTDSIKIPDATPEIIQFVVDYGKLYGYNFEHETTYDRMCLVNDAVYIAKYKDGEWTATGTQFAVPYVFKKLFSKEEIAFEDMCETKAVTSSLYLDMNEEIADGHNYRFIGKVGQFCPIKDGCGGGLLMREKDGKYYAVSGSKGFRWLESEMVHELGKEATIDRSYYDKMVDDATKTINNWGDLEWFVSDGSYNRYDNGILPF